MIATVAPLLDLPRSADHTTVRDHALLARLDCVESAESDSRRYAVAVLIRFTPSGMTRDQYWGAGKKLEDSGHWPPAGLLAHVCFGSEGDLRVSEVWESREQQ